MAAGAAGAQLVDRVQVEEVEPVGGLERPAELLGGRELGVVEERAVDRGDGDPVEGGAVAGVKATNSETPVDLAPGEPERKQLPTRNHAVLRAGEFGDLAVTWTLF